MPEIYNETHLVGWTPVINGRSRVNPLITGVGWATKHDTRFKYQTLWFFNRTIAKKCRPWGCHFVHMQANSRLWSCKSSGHGEFMEYLGPFSCLRSQFCSASLLSKMGQDEAAMIWLQKSAAQARGWNDMKCGMWSDRIPKLCRSQSDPTK